MKFVIDNRRPDGYYHYTITNEDPSITLSKVNLEGGWSLYSLQPEEQQQYWISAVQEFHREKYISGPTELLHKQIQDIRNSLELEDKKFEEKVPLVPPALGEIFSLIDSDSSCNDDFIAKLKSAGTDFIPTPKALIRYAWTAQKKNIKIDLEKAVRSAASSGISGFVNPVLDGVDNMIDRFFGTIDATYNETIRIAARAVRIYKSVENTYGKLDDNDQRKAIIDEFLKELKTYPKSVAEKVYEVLCIDALIEIFKSIKNLWSSREDIWNNLLNKLRALTDFDYKSLESNKINSLAAAIYALLPLLSSMFGAFMGKICGDNAVQEANDKLVNNNIKEYSRASENLEIDSNELILQLTEKEKEEFITNSVVYKYASSLSNDLSLYTYSSTPILENISSQDTPIDLPINCKVSMCETSDSTDIDALLHENSSLYPEQLIIEFNKDLRAVFNVKINQHVYINDIIAYINSIPVKSEKEFIVNEIYDTYIIGTYYYDTSLFNLESPTLQNDVTEYANNFIKSATTSEFDEVAKTIQNQSYAEDYILNYLSYCRFPEFALYTREHVSGIAQSLSTVDFHNEYTAPIDKFAKDLEKEFKKKAGRANVESKARAGKILSLKKEIDDEKLKLFTKVLNHYNINPGNLKFCSKGRISDFLLFDLYSEFLESDHFKYDEDNPFINKLFNAVTDFIAQRLRLEMNIDNVEALAESFNEICEKRIKKYWKNLDSNYYDVLSKMFEHNYYTNNNSIIEQADENDQDKVSLYSKVLGYLKSIALFKQDSYYEITTDEKTDINKLIEEQGKLSAEDSYDKSNKELEDSLKYVARKFISLRKIEQSMKVINISNYMNESTFNAAQALRESGGKLIDDYVDGVKYLVTDLLYGKETVLGPYTQMLKTLATKEAEILRSIMKDVLDIYKEKEEDPYSLKLFTKFITYPWPSAPGLIYYKNNKTDWYYFDKDKSPSTSFPRSIDDLIAAENEASADILNPNETIEASDGYPKTKYGIDTYLYWLRYCCMATITHCCLPMYWSTGLIIASPVLLPVIYIPIVVLKGRVTTVLGIGLCGMMPLPMILFVNLGFLKGTIIPPINMLVDYIMKLCNMLTNMEDKAIAASVAPAITGLDNEISRLENEKSDLEYQLTTITGVETNKKTETNIDISLGKDVTFKQQDLTPSSEEPAELTLKNMIDLRTLTTEDIDKMIKNKKERK